MSGPSLKQTVEAILFASNTPVTLKSLREALGGEDAPRIAEAIEELTREYDAPDRGVHIVALAGGYQILSREECSEAVEKYLKARRKARLSRAALETLAIIAYRQPVTKVEIDKIRGVDVGGVLGTLLERRLIVIKGRAKGVGSPLLYGTTIEFLTTFGLNRLDDLPRLEEMEGIVGDQAREALLAAREAAGLGEDLELIEVGAEGAPEAAGESFEDTPEAAGEPFEGAPEAAGEPFEDTPGAAGEPFEGAPEAAASDDPEREKEEAGGAAVVAEAGAAGETEPSSDARTPGRAPFGEEPDEEIEKDLPE